MMYKWNAERALRLIERHRVTHFIGVSAQTWDLLESPNFAATDTSSLTSVAGGGGPVPPQLIQKLQPMQRQTHSRLYCGNGSHARAVCK